MAHLEEVIDLLRGLLSDLHYAREEQNDYLRRHEICPACYHPSVDCECEHISEDDDSTSNGGENNQR